MVFSVAVVIWSLVDAILMLTTVSGNLLTLFAIILCRRLSEVVSNYFVFSLALSDLLVGITIPYHFFFSVGFRLSSNKQTCILRFMLVILACSSSIYSLLAIAADRYVAVVHPLHYNKYMNKKIVSCIIIFGWFCAFVFGSVIFYYNEWEDGEDCTLNEIVPTGYLTYGLTPMFISVWLAMLVVYLKIWRVAATHAKRIQKETKSKDVCVTDSKSVQVVMLILGCFSICWLPYFIAVTFLKILGYIPNILYEITFTMAMMNSSMNPLIYAWKNSNFRRAFWCMIRCKSPNQNCTPKNYITNHMPTVCSLKRATLKSTGKSDTTSNHTEIEMYDGRSQNEDKDWDQESTDNTTITTTSTLPRDTHNYI